jgi:hypothetical protein
LTWLNKARLGRRSIPLGLTAGEGFDVDPVVQKTGWLSPGRRANFDVPDCASELKTKC